MHISKLNLDSTLIFSLLLKRRKKKLLSYFRSWETRLLSPSSDNYSSIKNVTLFAFVRCSLNSIEGNTIPLCSVVAAVVRKAFPDFSSSSSSEIRRGNSVEGDDFGVLLILSVVLPLLKIIGVLSSNDSSEKDKHCDVKVVAVVRGLSVIRLTEGKCEDACGGENPLFDAVDREDEDSDGNDRRERSSEDRSVRAFFRCCCKCFFLEDNFCKSGGGDSKIGDDGDGTHDVRHLSFS